MLSADSPKNRESVLKGSFVRILKEGKYAVRLVEDVFPDPTGQLLLKLKVRCEFLDDYLVHSYWG